MVSTSGYTTLCGNWDIVNALIHHFLACQHLFENILLNLMFNLQ